MLLNDRTPIEQFDVAGPYEFVPLETPLEQFRNVALQTRPDLKVALQNVELALETAFLQRPIASLRSLTR